MTDASSPASTPRVEPFAYPAMPHVRKHGPEGYKDYAGYKPWLRDDFSFRCVYCLSRETWYPSGFAAFSVDHVKPQALHPDLLTTYTNLVYACNRCNPIKRDVTSLPDPTKEAFADLLEVDSRGRIKGRTTDGRRMIDLLHLDSDSATLVREERLLVLMAKQGHPNDPLIDRIFRSTFGYLVDLDDLRSKAPPGKNKRLGSEQDCCFARRERSELPEVY